MKKARRQKTAGFECFQLSALTGKALKAIKLEFT
jgi:hypothetical protein